MRAGEIDASRDTIYHIIHAIVNLTCIHTCMYVCMYVCMCCRTAQTDILVLPKQPLLDCLQAKADVAGYVCAWISVE